MTYNFNLPDEKNKDIKKWYRSKNNRQIMGVCQGLANYFELPVMLIRCAFVVSSLFGGWGILVYLILCLGKTEKEITTSKNISLKMTTKKFVDSMEQKALVTPKNFIYRLFRFLLLIILSVTTYFPVLLFLTMTIITVIISFFYPLLSVQDYSFSLPNLGFIGWAAGISCLILAFLGTYILCSWVMYFHFFRYHLKKQLSKCFILFIFVLSFNISSIAILYYSFFHIQVEKSWFIEETVDVNWDLWQKHINQLDIHVKHIVFRSHQKATTKIRYILYANGLQKKEITDFLQKMELDLALLSKPRWKNNFLWQQKFVPKLEILVLLPQNTSFQLKKSIAPLRIAGIFKDIDIDMENQRVEFIDCNIDQLVIHSQNGDIKIEKSQGKELAIVAKQSHLHLEHNTFTTNKVYNEYGNVEGKHLRGQVEIQNLQGNLYLEDITFAGNNTIQSIGGKNNILFFTDIPEIKIEQSQSHVRNKLSDVSHITNTLELKVIDSSLYIDKVKDFEK